MDATSVPRRATSREERGLEIFRRGGIERGSRDLYNVDSCTHRGCDYLVDLSGEGRCQCADSRRGYFCKHLFAATLYRAWIKRVARTVVGALDG